MLHCAETKSGFADAQAKPPFDTIRSAILAAAIGEGGKGVVSVISTCAARHKLLKRPPGDILHYFPMNQRAGFGPLFAPNFDACFT